MVNPQLPLKPAVAMPRLQDAKDGHKCSSKKKSNRLLSNKELTTSNQGQQAHKILLLPPNQTRLGQKRKYSGIEESNASHGASKKLKAAPQTSASSHLRPEYAPDGSGHLPVTLNNLTHIPNTTVANTTTYGAFVPTAPAILRWDKSSKSFVMNHVDQQGRTSVQDKTPQLFNQESAQKRKRSGLKGCSQEETDRGPKRVEIIPHTQEAGAIVNTNVDGALAKKRKNRKHLDTQSKVTSQICPDMRLEDLIPHYTLTSAAFADAKTKEAETLKSRPKQFMDLPLEVRLNIWDKVFENESYKFSVDKDSKRNEAGDMTPRPPPSFNCLFIHPSLAGEVAKQMYTSMRVEIDFDRLRPYAMRAFMTQIGNHRLGRESQRVFFIKKFGLHKVNMGHFAKAKEIVSTHWTIEGNSKMDEDDYLNNRIDPEHVLHAPASEAGNLKGLKERRFWQDQEAASQRYKRHMEGWCHPDAANPSQTVTAPDPNDPTSTIQVSVQVQKRPCPFENKCLNLKDTKFCLVAKYKFGCAKGRHSRHKEALYDFYPGTGRIVQSVRPKSKFYNKGGKGVGRN